MKDLNGTRVLITGAAVRIGRALALAFARAGARVVVHYNRNADAAADLLRILETFGPGHAAIQADLRFRAARRALMQAVFADAPPLTGLINNASVYRRGLLKEIAPEQFSDDFEVNFIAPFELMQAFARRTECGWIINMLDQRVAGVDPGAGAYGLAKKALRDATEAAALDWAPQIRVNGVAPGLVLPPPGVPAERMRPLLRQIPMQRQSTLDDVAEACLYLARAETVTGQVLFVDGGLHLPRPAVRERTPKQTPP